MILSFGSNLSLFRRLTGSLVKNFSSTAPQSSTSPSKKSPRLLNKSLFEKSLRCHRLGWFSRRNLLPSDQSATTEDERSSMKARLLQEGLAFEAYVFAHKYGWNSSRHGISSKEIGKKNRKEVLNGTDIALVDEASPEVAAHTTQLLMEEGTSNERTGGLYHSLTTILQPTFLHENLVARADVVVKMPQKSISNNDGSRIQDPTGLSSWEIVEIKSASGKSYRRKIPDLAFTVHVARLAGYNIKKASLIVVNQDFVLRDPESEADTERFENDDNLIYKTVDCTDLVNDYITETNMQEATRIIDEITGITNGRSWESSTPPSVVYKLMCGKCELLGVRCGVESNTDDESSFDDGIDEATAKSMRASWKDHAIWELPRLTEKRFPKVLERSMPSLEIADLRFESSDEEYDLLTKTQLDFRRAVLADAILVKSAKLQRRLKDIVTAGPMVGYLDFEAVSILRPPYPGMSPYETMVTQYSLHSHTSLSLGNDEFDDSHLSHVQYLADPGKDSRKALLEDLLSNLGYDITSMNTGTSTPGASSVAPAKAGAVLVYSSYEKTQLLKLADMFPEYAPILTEIIQNRLVDLEKILKECVVHPHFKGRSSIKVTLPALVPGFDQAYDRLEISDGGTASAAYAKLMSNCHNDDTIAPREAIEKALLDYCRLDTLALVEIHKTLRNLLRDKQKEAEAKAKEVSIGSSSRTLERNTVAELKSFLRDRGLPVTGRKSALIERLLSHQDRNL